MRLLIRKNLNSFSWEDGDRDLGTPDEVGDLLEECLPLEKESMESEAKGFLIAITYACKEAIRNESGLFLASD